MLATYRYPSPRFPLRHVSFSIFHLFLGASQTTYTVRHAHPKQPLLSPLQEANHDSDTDAIQAILPHRYPLLLVSTIEEMERWKRIIGIKNVTIDEYFFQGHFPGKPIMPGVLIIKSMAQTGGFLLLQEVKDREKKLVYFVAIDDARFRRPVVPGDQFRIEVDVIGWRGSFCKIHGRATVPGELAAEATLMCKMVDMDEVQQPAPASAEKAQ